MMGQNWPNCRSTEDEQGSSQEGRLRVSHAKLIFCCSGYKNWAND